MPTLREYRIERNLGPVELASQAGVSTNSIYRMESGKPVYKSTLIRIAKALNVSASEIAGVVLARQPQSN